MIEIETKIFDVDKEKTINIIKMIWWKYVSESQITWQYFKKWSKKVRIRQLDWKWFACMKIKNRYEDWVRTREEFEFEVSDKDAFIWMITNLWFSFHKEIDKKRTSYRLFDIQFDIDEYENWLTILEIEWPTATKIKKISKEMWFKNTDLSSMSVTEYLNK